MTNISSEIVEKLRFLSEDFDRQLSNARTEHEIRQVKAAYLGRQGHVSEILKSLSSLSPEDRPLIGQEANKLKKRLESLLKEALDGVQKRRQTQRLSEECLDPTLSGISYKVGSHHPITQVMMQIEEIFRCMGFEVHEGPEIETEYYNFEALNIPQDHPARDMQDTFYLGVPIGAEGGYSHHIKNGVAYDDPQTPKPKTGKAGSSELLLRTHTSPVQIHVMKKMKPPVQIIAPGPVYRRDSDVSHTPMFHQIEGLLVDKVVAFAHLKGVLEVFLHEFFGPETAVRFRPSYFPFTEPSAEVDISCVMCPKHRKDGSGIGCRVCQRTGWLEVMGCGMVNPAVFESVGYDPKKWTGFAFGMGIERLAMLKYRINDIRLFYENDLRFLEQFR
jgi:phenylalanyl-tRNA synthetase alpha chain